MFLSNTSKLQNDPYCKLYLPFQNSVAEEKSVGKSETHTVTNNGNVAITTVDGRKCASFNGTDQYLTIPDSDDWNLGNNLFTLHCSIYVISMPEIASHIISKYDYINDKRSWEVGIDQAINKFVFVYSTTGELPANAINSDVTVALNVWTDIVVIRNRSNDLIMYVNGTQSGTMNMGSDSIYDSDTTLYIGTDVGTQTNNFNGYIAEPSIHKGVARYTRNFTPQTRGI